MSTCLKLKNQVELDGTTIVLCSYPRFVEILGNNFNQIVNNFQDIKNSDLKANLPSYNINAARKALKRGAKDAYKEVTLSWSSLFSTYCPQRDALIMRIHGVSYDVTKFKHPGGPVSIQLGKGRDATALFEAHHPFTSKAKLASILKKYETDYPVELLSSREEDTTKDVFDWSGETDEEQFIVELKSRVKDYFKSEAKRRGVTFQQATKATTRRWIEMIFFFGGFLLTIPFYVQGYWITIVLLPVFAWLYAAAITHDSMHFAISGDWRINSLMGYCSPWTASPLMWYHQHVIGHHAYPNIPFRDPDLAHAPAFVRLHESIRWKPLHKFQIFSVGLIWTLGAALYMTLVPLKALFAGALNRSVILMKMSSTRVIMHVLGRILTALVLWGWQWYVFRGDIARQLLFTIAPMLIHSLCFMFSTQLNHLTSENMKESKNYYVHQVLTSHSFSRDSTLVYYFTGGLNLQIEHHLFPTVNHCHLKALSPIVRELCDKYNIPYHESSSVYEAISKHFQHVTQMGKPKRKPTQGNNEKVKTS